MTNKNNRARDVRMKLMVVSHPEYRQRSSLDPPQGLRHRAAHWAVAKALQNLTHRRPATLRVRGQREHSDPVDLAHSQRHPSCCWKQTTEDLKSFNGLDLIKATAV